MKPYCPSHSKRHHRCEPNAALIFRTLAEFLLKQKTVVIDPGHGGRGRVGGSDGNHAVSRSGALEKNMTLQTALLVERELARIGGGRIKTVLTRRTDTNLGLAARANFAKFHKADVFLSIHFNAFNGRARGVSAHVRYAADNVNLAEDTAFARRVQQAVYRAIAVRDTTTRDRGIVFNQFGVLADAALGNTAAAHRCRACLLEVEFIDTPAVDVLLNTGPHATRLRSEIASSIAGAICADLAAYR